jgi:hypothetical protein
MSEKPKDECRFYECPHCGEWHCWHCSFEFYIGTGKDMKETKPENAKRKRR